MRWHGAANNAGLQGAKGDLGANWAREWTVRVQSAVASAATAGLELEIFWGPSQSSGLGTNNPAGLLGISGVLATPDEYKAQCLYVGSLVMANAAGTAIQCQYLNFFPPTRWGCPVVVNKTGQTTTSTATDHSLVFTPIEEVIQELVT